MPTYFQDRGLSLNLRESPFSPSPLNHWMNITHLVSAYSHEVSIYGGYVSSTSTMPSTIDEAVRLYSRGIGKDVQVTNSGGDVVWNGFINQVIISVGGEDIATGKLTDVINKMTIEYTTKRFNTNPPVGGKRKVLAAVEEQPSIEQWGVLEGILNLGTQSATTATTLRDGYLADFAYPRAARTLELNSGNLPNVKLECVGYSELWKKYYYKQILDTSYITFTQKLLAVLAADPNQLFTNLGGVDEIAAEIRGNEDGSRNAYEIIKELSVFGNGAQDVAILGVFDNRKVVYSQTPNAILYTRKMDGPDKGFYRGGQWVEPWDVRVGQWVYTGDLFPSSGIPVYPGSFKSDRRVQLIGNIVYTAPYQLSVSEHPTWGYSELLGKTGIRALR